MDNVFKILYYFHETDDIMIKWQRIHIFDELKHHNCEIKVCDPSSFENINDANEKILNEIDLYKPHLFMTPYNENELFIQTIKAIKMKGVPTLLICADNLTIPYYHLKVSKYYDLVWLTAQETKYLFEKACANTIFLPYAANPYLHGGKERIEGVGFIGSPYGSRVNTINSLIENSIDVYCHNKKTTNKQTSNDNIRQSVRLFNSIREAMRLVKFKEGRKVLHGACINKLCGNNNLIESSFLHSENIVEFRELFNTYSKYTLSLSFTSARNTGVLKKPLDIVNLRNFEIPMSGGIQFCRYSEEMATYFENNKEIVMYKDDEEMIDKARFYLKESSEVLRSNIRKAARKRAESCHTWWKRFKAVSQELNLHIESYDG